MYTITSKINKNDYSLSYKYWFINVYEYYYSRTIISLPSSPFWACEEPFKYSFYLDAFISHIQELSLWYTHPEFKEDISSFFSVKPLKNSLFSNSSQIISYISTNLLPTSSFKAFKYDWYCSGKELFTSQTIIITSFFNILRILENTVHEKFRFTCDDLLKSPSH